MKIKPTHNWEICGTGVKLSREKIYKATHATNQPNWKERGKVFVHHHDDGGLFRDFSICMLVKGEYEIISN